MSTAQVNIQGSSLVEGPDEAQKPSESLIAKVTSEYGVHPLKQLGEILWRRVGAQKLGANEYYDLRLFDPKYSRSEKNAFLGQGGVNALNLKINPDTLMETKNFVGNKLVYTAHLRDHAIATTDTQAFVATTYSSEADFLLKDEADFIDFMRNGARYPLFGKPQGGSLSVGSIRIERLDGDTLLLGNGKTVGLTRFVSDVFKHYADGYLLQTALSPHKTLAQITGKAVGCVRVVTVRAEESIKPLYALWKIPGPSAMSDNFWQTGTMLALIDLANGQIIKCRRGSGLQAEEIRRHPASGEELKGLQIPFWNGALASAIAAHDLTPTLGVCGFDIAITDDGPVIVECNDRPNHMLYQYASQKGINNPEFRAVFKSILKSQRH